MIEKAIKLTITHKIIPIINRVKRGKWRIRASTFAIDKYINSIKCNSVISKKNDLQNVSEKKENYDLLKFFGTYKHCAVCVEMSFNCIDCPLGDFRGKKQIPCFHKTLYKRIERLLKDENPSVVEDLEKLKEWMEGKIK